MTMMILFVHSLVFTSYAKHATIDIDNPTLLHLMALIPNGLLVPMTAGAVQALSLQDHFANNRLANFRLRPILLISLSLGFLESFKAALVYQPSVFFGWNALHFLALAIVTVLVLARWSVHLVLFSAVACLALTPLIRTLLRPFQILTVEQARTVNELGLPPLFQLLLCIGILFWIFWWIFTQSKVEQKFKIRLFLIALVLFNLTVWVVMSNAPEFYFVTRILNLPVGALIGDKLGLHYWPFFPWYSGVAIGFYFYYLLAHASHRKLVRRMALAIAASGLIVHFGIFEEDIRRRYNRETVWSDALFNDHLSFMAFCISSFVVFALAFEQLARSRRWEQLCGRFPSLWRVPFVYSKTILWAYLFINTFGVWLGRWIGPYLPSLEARAIFSLLLAIVWYWLGELILKWMSRTRLTVRLSPAR